MLQYSPLGGCHFFKRLVHMRGSVFPAAFSVAIPCGLVAAALRQLINMGYIPWSEPDSILTQTQAWSGFSGLVGFLIVFRTSQSYTRFWSGCTATHRMRAEWFDACCQLVAFTKTSKASAEAIDTFLGKAVRLFSMLHAVALAELEELNHDVDCLDEIQAFNFKIIDPQGFDEQSLSFLEHSASKVELAFFWIQLLLVEGIDSGVLALPPPILSRSFQALSNGMVAFYDAIKLTYCPFPFPYAQTCDLLLAIHWLIAPLVICQWVAHPAWAATFVILQVFILWSLNLIACEIENPFGADANDLDGQGMQEEMNGQLLLLTNARVSRPPNLSREALPTGMMLNVDGSCTMSLVEAWSELEEDEEEIHESLRKGKCFNRSSVFQMKVAPHRFMDLHHRHASDYFGGEEGSASQTVKKLSLKRVSRPRVQQSLHIAHAPGDDVLVPGNPGVLKASKLGDMVCSEKATDGRIVRIAGMGNVDEFVEEEANPNAHISIQASDPAPNTRRSTSNPRASIKELSRLQPAKTPSGQPRPAQRPLGSAWRQATQPAKPHEEPEQRTSRSARSSKEIC